MYLYFSLNKNKTLYARKHTKMVISLNKSILLDEYVIVEFSLDIVFREIFKLIHSMYCRHMYRMRINIE
jgi:hypothetical protein